MPVESTDFEMPLPTQAPRPQHDRTVPTPTPPPIRTPPMSEADPRPGDSGDDRPPQVPQYLAPLSAADVAAIESRQETELQRELREIEERIVTGETGWLPNILRGPVVGSALILSAVSLGLFLFNQVASLLIALATLPSWGQYLGWAVLGIAGLLTTYAIARFTAAYFRYRANRQLQLDGLVELDRRTRLRWLAEAKSREARDQLTRYLSDYPLSDSKDRKVLLRTGFTLDRLAELERVRTELLDRERWGGDDRWFVAFRERFQSHLDSVAQERVRSWARRTGVITAASPNALTDSLSALYASFTMLGDLCTIYRLRAGRTATAVILSRIFAHAYLAGQTDGLETLTAEQLQEWVTPHLPVSEMLLGKLFGKIGAKASVGVLNYFLITRLGKFSIRLLQPMSGKLSLD